MIRFFILLVLTLFSTGARCQKRVATEQDYALWGTLSLSAFSGDGKWVAYHTRQQGSDTLFIYNTASGSRTAYPLAYSAAFSNNSRFACISGADSTRVIELATGRKTAVPNRGQVSFTSNSDRLIMHDRALSQISLLDLRTYSVQQIEQAEELLLSPGKNRAATIKISGTGKQEVILHHLTSGATPVSIAAGAGFYNMAWNSHGNAIAFYEKVNDRDSYRLVAATRRGNIWRKTILEESSLPEGQHRLAPSQLSISNDGAMVYFYPQPADAVVWDKRDNDKTHVLSSPSLQLRVSAPNSGPEVYWHAWDLQRAKVVLLETMVHPKAVLTGDGRHALVFDDKGYLPQIEYTNEYIDLYLLDIATGTKDLLLKKQIYHPGQTVLSPAGKYILYFRDKQWWVYDITKRAHRCISGAIPHALSKADYDLPGYIPAYSCGGWELNDKAVYIYDEYDIWRVDPATGKAQKITEGRENKISYRIYDSGLTFGSTGKVFGFQSRIVEMPLSITALNVATLAEGIVVWDREKGLRELLEKDRHIFSITKAKDVPKWLYFESDFNCPPALNIVTENVAARTVAASNPQHKDFLWGRSQLIRYTVNGKELKGALFFPAEYDPSLQYPMVVNIYERLSHTLHKYTAPDEGSDNGMNIAHLTLKGYFVFCPDIAYAVNHPGESALQCVTEAVNAVVQKHNVDKDRLALVGHSFGGYQATYIMGRSQMFKTAIAGAPVTDLKSFYLSFNGSGLPNMDLFYSYQFRLNVPFGAETFSRNSPLEFVREIKAPLLLWTSDSDPVVDYRQSVMLFNALWTLGRECLLLIYRGEDHSLLERSNQVDLSRKLLDWLNYHLKGNKKPGWTVGDKS